MCCCHLVWRLFGDCKALNNCDKRKLFKDTQLVVNHLTSSLWWGHGHLAHRRWPQTFPSSPEYQSNWAGAHRQHYPNPAPRKGPWSHGPRGRPVWEREKEREDHVSNNRKTCTNKLVQKDQEHVCVICIVYDNIVQLEFRKCWDVF